MYIQSIKLKNFRNYETLSLDFAKGINIIYGKNAQGKTNLLESIYVLGITKSHRSFIDNHLIQDGQNFCKIEGTIKKGKIPFFMEYLFSNQKELKIDHNKISKISDYISKMNIIIFYPEDLEIVKGSPTTRRRFLNLELSQLYSNYYSVLNDYHHLLKIRNDYLKKLSLGLSNDINYLNILNQYFVDKGTFIYRMRLKFVDRLNEISPKIFENITGLKGFKIVYKDTIDITNNDAMAIKKSFLTKLEKIYKRELKFTSTLVGPHRDDFEFYLDDKNLKQYGSQGQQRVAVLALKLAEIEIFKKYTYTTPILLLDDIFSELDNKKKNNLLRYIKNNIQTIITTTDLTNINQKIIDKAKLIEIEEGTIKKIKEVNNYGK